MKEKYETGFQTKKIATAEKTVKGAGTFIKGAGTLYKGCRHPFEIGQLDSYDGFWIMQTSKKFVAYF